MDKSRSQTRTASDGHDDALQRQEEAKIWGCVSLQQNKDVDDMISLGHMEDHVMSTKMFPTLFHGSWTQEHKTNGKAQPLRLRPNTSILG